MISPASQRAIDRTWRWVAPTRRRSPSSRPRRSANIASVLGTAIDVKAKIMATQDVPLRSLSPREREVLELVAEGRSNRPSASAWSSRTAPCRNT
jgi:DNA-binding NarL/FixJ family response regulator